MWSYSIGARIAQLAFCGVLATQAAHSYACATQLPETGFDLQAAQANPSAKQKSRKNKQADHAADQAAMKPSASIPITSLGFAPPASYYLGQRYSQASLGFLDETHILFTFRVPGLIPREPGNKSQPSERHIRAVTLSIPTGEIVAEGLWSVHDYQQYLWILGGGKFLLRDRNEVQVGDASLHLEPFLRFPGSVHYLELDPARRMLVTNTSEPPAPEENQPGNGGAANHSPAPDSNSSAPEISHPDVQTPGSTATAVIANSTPIAQRSATGSSSFTLDSQKPANQNLVRVLSLADRKVLLYSHTNGTVHIPVDGEGYYESLRGSNNKWMVSFEFFSGATVPLVWVDSACDPALEAVASNVVLASACIGNGARSLTAILRDRDKDHTRLWELSLPPTKIWPLIARSADGLRFARSTLDVSHPVNAYNPLDDSDIRGQSVQVYDVANGQLQLTIPTSPILDAGGNFALSPTGKRLAVLHNGNIEVYDLPSPPPIPPAGAIR